MHVERSTPAFRSFETFFGKELKICVVVKVQVVGVSRPKLSRDWCFMIEIGHYEHCRGNYVTPYQRFVLSHYIPRGKTRNLMSCLKLAPCFLN